MAIELKNVSKSFGGVKALSDVSVSFGGGKIYGLLGSNGAGKTTMLNIITNRLYADSGEVLIDGERAPGRDRALGKVYMMAEQNLFPDSMKVKAAISVTADFIPGFDTELALELGKKFGLPLNKKVKALSTGYSSILRIVLALSAGTPYVIFDEPVLGLDAQHRDMFYRLLMEHCGGGRADGDNLHAPDTGGGAAHRARGDNQGRRDNPKRAGGGAQGRGAHRYRPGGAGGRLHRRTQGAERDVDRRAQDGLRGGRARRAHPRGAGGQPDGPAGLLYKSHERGGRKMNFLPIFKYRLKDDLRAVAVFLAVTLLCMVLVIYGIMIMVAEMDDRVVSNFSIALTVFTFVIGIVTVREDLRLGIQNGVSRGTSLAASFAGNVAAALVASAGVTLVEWLSMATQESTNASLVSLYAVIYGYESSAVGQLKSFVLSFVWSGSAAFVGTFLSLMYWRLSKLWRWIVTLGMGAVLVLLLNAVTISAGFLNAVVRFFRWLGAAPLNLCVFLIGVAIAFAVFDWLLARKAPITAATA